MRMTTTMNKFKQRVNMKVRSHVRRARHELAAELLSRLAEDIHFFPTLQHQVSILTSAVIECNRAGLKREAQRWARALMQPQYRPHIDPKYVKKIEYVVRHGAGGAAPARDAPCPRCAAPTPVAALTCGNCQQMLPFCVATEPHNEGHLSKCDVCALPAEAALLCGHDIGIGAPQHSVFGLPHPTTISYPPKVVSPVRLVMHSGNSRRGTPPARAAPRPRPSPR
ncbi:unnamed protein product [Plutella xylostella]|uniref:(diamondback moth) hypothetical protein n=1 Tax=Plutella xylostella TaxID=51655 RepID=A0A8S4D4X0_PLUXY|nr:unnamed protein product [Plutella xylostella]